MRVGPFPFALIIASFLLYQTSGVRDYSMNEEDYYKAIKLVGMLQDRVEKLEADVIRNRAESQAVFLCLRDATHIDPNSLSDKFDFYVKECHQKQLERIEDVSPGHATKMDKRTPGELP
jgi:hypothetical protein